VSGGGIILAVRKSAPCSRRITTPAPHHSYSNSNFVSYKLVDSEVFLLLDQYNWPLLTDVQIVVIIVLVVLLIGHNVTFDVQHFVWFHVR